MIHHGLAFGTLRHVADGQAVQLHLAVVSFFNEKHLAAAARHLGRFGIEPTRTCGVARAGFLKLAGDFPRGFVFWCVHSQRRKS